MGGQSRDPDTCADIHRHRILRDGHRIDSASYPLGKTVRFVHICLRQDHHELVPPIAGEQIVYPDVPSQDRGRRRQCGIPHLMAIGIIHQAKVIQVDHQQGKRMIASLRARHFLFQTSLEGSVIEQPGQAILGGLGQCPLV